MVVGGNCQKSPQSASFAPRDDEYCQMDEKLIYCSLIFFVAFFVRGLTGFGAGLVAIPVMATMYPPAFLSDANDPDGWWWLAQFILIDGKMRGLFSILFMEGGLFCVCVCVDVCVCVCVCVCV